MEQRIFSSEAAKLLGIGVSTLRNYAVALEAKGHRFERGTNNGRIFLQADLHLIEEMLEKITKENMTIEQAAEQAYGATTHIEEVEVERDEEEIIQLNHYGKIYEQLNELREQQVKLTDVNLALAKQVERLTEKIEERERDQELFQRLQNTEEKKEKKRDCFLAAVNADG